jgi:hypothetical protein
VGTPFSTKRPALSVEVASGVPATLTFKPGEADWRAKVWAETPLTTVPAMVAPPTASAGAGMLSDDGRVRGEPSPQPNAAPASPRRRSRK